MANQTNKVRHYREKPNDAPSPVQPSRAVHQDGNHRALRALDHQRGQGPGSHPAHAVSVAQPALGPIAGNGLAPGEGLWGQDGHPVAHADRL